MLCISLDGFKPSYYRHAPHLKSLLRSSRHGDLETVFAYTGIGASFFTGLYPDEHGVFAMFEAGFEANVLGRFSFLGNSMLSYMNNIKLMLSGKTYFHKLYYIPPVMLPYVRTTILHSWPREGCIKARTLFDHLRENGKKFTYIDPPNIFTNGKAGLLRPRSDLEIEKIMMKYTGRNDFMFANFHDLDTACHRHGTKSEEVKEKVEVLDGIISRMVPEKDYLIWSDHGFLDVKGTVDVQSALSNLKLRPGKDYVYFLDSTAARFWFKEDDAKRLITEALHDLEHVNVLSSNDRKRLHVPKCADIMFICDPGYIVSPNFFNGSDKVKGMHGYDPSHPDQKGIYVTDGQGKANANITDMMRLILSRMGIRVSKAL